MPDSDGFREAFHVSQDGLTLYLRDYRPSDPDGDRLPVICLPGLTRNSRDFHDLALAIARDPASPRRVFSIDSRGRGGSDRDANTANYNLALETADVLAICAAFGIGRAVFIGTSRGGLILHLIAATRPDLPAAVILNDVGPVIEAEGLKKIRDYLNRDRKPQSWDEAEEILRENHGASFTALEEEDWRDMARAIYRDVGGRPVADFDPVIAEQLTSIDLDGPLPDLWPQFEALAARPLMLVRGGNSTLLSEETVGEMARRCPGMRLLVAEGQGHAPILHRGNLRQEIAAFLASMP
ncbi:alpha/beta fold hydrolase [Rhizobium binxianense]